MNLKNKKIKIEVLLVSILIAIIMSFLNIYGNTLVWGAEKIIILLLVMVWSFFLIPAILQFRLSNFDKDRIEFISNIYWIYIDFVFYLLAAPYFGSIYYFKK